MNDIFSLKTNAKSCLWQFHNQILTVQRHKMTFNGKNLSFIDFICLNKYIHSILISQMILIQGQKKTIKRIINRL